MISKLPVPAFQLPPSIVIFPNAAMLPVLIATSPPSEFCRVKLPSAVSEFVMIKVVREALFGLIMIFDSGKAPVIVWPFGAITKVPPAAATAPAVHVIFETEQIVPANVSVPDALLNCKFGIFPVVCVSLPVNV